MAQAKLIYIRLRPGCGAVEIDMYPDQVPSAVKVDIPAQFFTPPELRTLARLLEQAADRKEELFTVVAAS